MPLSSVFQISVYSLTCLASLILAYGEGAVWPQALTPPLALMALFFTEKTQRFRLPIMTANLLGLIAFSAAIIEFFGEDIESKLLSGAHLIVYLTWVVMFQRKSTE